MAKKRYHSGQPAPMSGEMKIIGSRGGDTGKTRTVIWKKPLPPTPKPDQAYVPFERAHNKAGHGK